MARLRAPSALDRLALWLSIALVLALLYFGQAVLMSLALAVLLSFLLAPLVGALERWVGRVTAVIAVSALAFMVLAAVTTLVLAQLVDLAASLPKYEDNIRAKIRLVAAGGGPFSRTAQTLRHISQDLGAGPPATQPLTQPAPAPAPQALPSPSQPVVIAVPQPASSPWSVLATVLGPLLQPVATAGVVTVLVIFILLQRDDLRDRFIRLAGIRQISTTTRALDDAAHRVSRYLLMLLLVNATYGLPVGLGLYFLGVPNAPLWGFLAMALRFIPYVGPWLAASLPIAVSLAAFPGWLQPLLVIGLFLVLEIVSNNVVEPVLYGKGTGVSPMGILVAAVIWTWLWGAPGLLLATPMTVCLVVMGRHIPQMAFLEVLFGDRPVLPPRTQFYQRLLAAEVDDAREVLLGQLAAAPLPRVYDQVVLPTLLTLERDARHGRLTPPQTARLRQQMAGLIQNLGDRQPQPDSPQGQAKATMTPATIDDVKEALRDTQRAAVLCLPAQDADDLAATMLEQSLRARGVRGRAVSAQRLTSEAADEVAAAGAKVVCISALPPGALAHARYLCKRLRQRHGPAELTIVVGLWQSRLEPADALGRLRGAGAERVARSLEEAMAILCPLAQSAQHCEPGNGTGNAGAAAPS